MNRATAAPPPLSAPPPIVPRDFPGWLPPMLVKELRQGLRTRGFVGTLVGFQLVMLVLTLIALSSQSSGTAAARATGSAISTGFFWTILSVQMLIITPSRALGGMQLEADGRTLDLLVLTRLNAWRIVLGKWISLLAQAVLLLVAMLPYLIIRYFTDNADLLTELGRCCLMLGLSAVLTAAGLWGSGVAKIVRVLMAIAMGIFMVNVLGVLGPMFSGRGGALGRSPFANVIDLPFDIFNGVFLTGFFLVSAVRNVAPAAENHSLFTRILPVLMLLPAPFAEVFGAHALAVRQLYLSAAFLGFVLLFELASTRLPMPPQWRDWYKSGKFSCAIGRCSLPGWPSALLFGAIATALWVAVAFSVLSLAPSAPGGRGHAPAVAWLALLAFSGIVFPAVMQSLLRAVPVSPALLYFSGLGIPGLLAGVSLWLAESRWKFTELKSFMETMPFSSFLFKLNARDQSPLIVVAQGVVAVLVLGLAFWQTRAYWRQLASFEARDRAASEAGAAPTE